jgi:hypothetical protein
MTLPWIVAQCTVLQCLNMTESLWKPKLKALAIIKPTYVNGQAQGKYSIQSIPYLETAAIRDCPSSYASLHDLC